MCWRDSKRIFLRWPFQNCRERLLVVRALAAAIVEIDPAFMVYQRRHGPGHSAAKISQGPQQAAADRPIDDPGRSRFPVPAFPSSPRHIFIYVNALTCYLVEWGHVEDLTLAGGEPRGSLYCVYTFLEEQAGCRRCSPSRRTLPKPSTLSVGELDVRVASLHSCKLARSI